MVNFFDGLDKDLYKSDFLLLRETSIFKRLRTCERPITKKLKFKNVLYTSRQEEKEVSKWEIKESSIDS